MCLPKSNHRKLIQDCYPLPKALIASAPEYRPNSNELSRLAYYACNKPAKLSKVGKYLESKAATDAKLVKATGVTADKGKASLMITLDIVKNLLTECKSHLNYFISSAQSVIALALNAASANASDHRDLDISARAASTFFALASYIDPTTTNVDKGFQILLESFASISVESPVSALNGVQDIEQRNRTRIIGLGALAGTVGSDAIYAANSNPLLSLVVPALLENIKDNRVTLDWLSSEAKKVTDGHPSYAEFNFKKKPLASRRAPSISGHVDGEKGPTTEDVTSVAIATLQGLLRQTDASHVQACVQYTIAYLDTKSALPIPKPKDGRQLKSPWENVDWCCWLAESFCSWTALPYRFVVLTSLIEHLVESCQGQPTVKHVALIEMIRTILTGKLSLIGLSTSDTLSSLAGLVVRRVYKDTRDSLLPPLVNCISGLGTHIYYAEQVNDIAEEIVTRITALQMTDSTSTESSTVIAASTRDGSTDINPHMHRQRVQNAGLEQRGESIRILLFCLMGILRTAHQSSGEVNKAAEERSKSIDVQDKGKATADDIEAKIALSRAGTRNRVSPCVLIPTASLLVFPNHAVRHAYIQTLVTLFRDEFERQHLSDVSAGVSEPVEKIRDSVGFVHAIGAAVHAMCLCKNLFALEMVPNHIHESPLQLLPQLERINADPAKPSLLVGESSVNSSTDSTTALPLDYIGIAQVLEEMIKALPNSAALGLAPMLVTLDKDAGAHLMVNGASASGFGLENQRRIATRLVAARGVDKLAHLFDIPAASKSAQAVLAQIPSFGLELGPTPPTSLSLPLEAVSFDMIRGINGAGESSTSSSPSMDRNALLDGLASSPKLQKTTELEQAVLKRWLERDWSVGIAVDEAITGSSPYGRGVLGLPCIGSRRPSFTSNSAAASNGLKANDTNSSSSSVTHSGRSDRLMTGVEDFREALGGASSVASNSNGSSRILNDNGPTYGSGFTSTSNAIDISDRRASRKEARRGGAGGIVSGTTLDGTPGQGKSEATRLLDSLKVGIKESASENDMSTLKVINGTRPIEPPYAV